MQTITSFGMTIVVKMTMINHFFILPTAVYGTIISFLSHTNVSLLITKGRPGGSQVLHHIYAPYIFDG